MRRKIMETVLWKLKSFQNILRDLNWSASHLNLTLSLVSEFPVPRVVRNSVDILHDIFILICLIFFSNTYSLIVYIRKMLTLIISQKKKVSEAQNFTFRC